MSPHHTTPALVQCERCGIHRHAGHPIDVCFGCDPNGYASQFSELRKRAVWTHFVGHDGYSDTFYFERDGVVLRVEGRFMGAFRGRVSDAAVAELTKLKAENVEVFAENARLRRRLEGK